MYIQSFIHKYTLTLLSVQFLKISLWVIVSSSKMKGMMTWSTSSHLKFDIRETLSIIFDCVSTKHQCYKHRVHLSLYNPALCWLRTRPARQVQQLDPRVVVWTGLCGDNSLWFQDSHLSISFSCYQTLAWGIFKPSWISMALVLTPVLPGTFSSDQ